MRKNNEILFKKNVCEIFGERMHRKSKQAFCEWVIKQSQEIAFNAISFKDAIVLLPIMDALVNMVNKNRVASLWQSLPKEDKEKYRKAYSENNIYLQEHQTEKILQILTDLGFESSFDLKEATMSDLELK